jgi:hypothetical protein
VHDTTRAVIVREQADSGYYVPSRLVIYCWSMSSSIKDSLHSRTLYRSGLSRLSGS